MIERTMTLAAEVDATVNYCRVQVIEAQGNLLNIREVLLCLREHLRRYESVAASARVLVARLQEDQLKLGEKPRPDVQELARVLDVLNQPVPRADPSL